MKPIIGIVGRTNKVEFDKYKIIVNDNHRRAIIVCGGIPIKHKYQPKVMMIL